MSSEQPLQTVETNASWADLFSNGNALRTLTLVGGVALYAINMYIVTTILPNIVNDIGGLEFFSWNTTLFIVTSIIGSTMTNKLVINLGPKFAYLLALLLFAVGSIGCAIAFNMPFLLLGRAFQGLGGGIMFALGYTLIRIVFEQHLWTRATALVSAMWGLSTLFGPTIGGFFAQGGHWRWAFWSLLPFIIVLAIIVNSQITQKIAEQDNEQPKIPFYSLALLILSVIFISLSSLKEEIIWTTMCLIIGLMTLVWMIKVDKNSSNKLLPTGAYSLSTTLCRTYLVMILLMIAMTTEIFVPYFLQIIHGMKPLSAGYMTAIMAAGWTISALPSAAKLGKTRRTLMMIGPFVVTCSLIALAFTMSNNVYTEILLFIIYGFALFGIGFGIGLIWPHLLNLVFVSAPKGEETLTSASITTVQLYATALAAAFAGLVANQAGLVRIGGVIGAQVASNWLFALFSIAPILAIFLVIKILKLPMFQVNP